MRTHAPGDRCDHEGDKSGDWGVGGKAFACADVKALAGGKEKFLPCPYHLPQVSLTLRILEAETLAGTKAAQIEQN